MESVTNSNQCEEFGKGANSFRALMKACRTCKITRECYERSLEYRPIFRWDHMISVVCDRENEYDVNKAMKKIDDYAKKQLSKIENCDIYFGANDESNYFEER